MNKFYINARISMGLLLLVLCFVLSRQAGLMASGQAVAAAGVKKPVVVIDVGHGGGAERLK